MDEHETVNQVKHEIQIALVARRESEAALQQGETSKACDVIRARVTRLAGRLHDSAQSHFR